jgi:hypothetical protein
VTRLGADEEAMVSVILKSDLLNGGISLSGGMPIQSRRTLDRIRALQASLRRERDRTPRTRDVA